MIHIVYVLCAFRVFWGQGSERPILQQLQIYLSIVILVETIMARQDLCNVHATYQYAILYTDVFVYV